VLSSFVCPRNSGTARRFRDGKVGGIGISGFELGQAPPVHPCRSMCIATM
jgi:hypothetical protein